MIRPAPFRTSDFSQMSAYATIGGLAAIRRRRSLLVNPRFLNAMLAPQFSIRTLLVVLSVCAVAFLFVGMAYRGQTWAWGMSIGLFSVLITALVHAAWFSVIWMFARPRPSKPTKPNAASNP